MNSKFSGMTIYLNKLVFSLLIAVLLPFSIVAQTIDGEPAAITKPPGVYDAR